MTIRQFLSLVEIKTKIVSLSTFSISLSYIFLRGMRPPLVHVLILFLAVLMVDMGTTAWNSFYDYFRGTDRGDRESEKVLVHESLAPGTALIVAALLFGAASLIGLYFVILKGWIILMLGGLSLLVGFFYSGGKHPISHGPLGELFAGGFLGCLLFIIIQIVLGNGVLDDGAPMPAVWIMLSLPSTLHIAAILTTNNCCDLEADKEAGRRTLSILIGRRASWVLIGLLVFSAYLLAALLSLLSLGGLGQFGVWIHLFALLCAVPVFRAMLKTGFVQSAKGRAMGGISTLFLIHSAAQLAAIWLTIWVI